MNETDKERAGYIDGLRALADVLEQNPGIPLPGAGRVSTMTVMFHGDDAKAALAAAARAFPCAWQKRFSGRDGEYFDLLGKVGGLRVELTAMRDVVCERVVTGTAEVEEDEVVTEAVTRKVTKTVDVVEWRCGSLLAPAADDKHEWVRDEQERGEGLICRKCGATEAELEQAGDPRCWRA
jgi:hypothetical protein